MWLLCSVNALISRDEAVFSGVIICKSAEPSPLPELGAINRCFTYPLVIEDVAAFICCVAFGPPRRLSGFPARVRHSPNDQNGQVLWHDGPAGLETQAGGGGWVAMVWRICNGELFGLSRRVGLVLMERGRMTQLLWYVWERSLHKSWASH